MKFGEDWTKKVDFLCLFIIISFPPTRDPMGSTTSYEHFLLGTHRRCHIINLGRMGLVVLVKKMFKEKYIIDPYKRSLGSKTWYEQFLLGTRRRCYIVMLVKLAQAVLKKKMFKEKYVIDPPTRDPLGSKTGYEQFLSRNHRRCDV